ncbi:hypothetical protein Dimus_013375, partial [Dionaea muscipula]
DRLNTRWTEPPPPDHPPIFIPLPGSTTISRAEHLCQGRPPPSLDSSSSSPASSPPARPCPDKDSPPPGRGCASLGRAPHHAGQILTLVAKLVRRSKPPGCASPRCRAEHEAGLSIDAVLRTLFTRSCAAGLTHQARTPS